MKLGKDTFILNYTNKGVPIAMSGRVIRAGRVFLADVRSCSTKHPASFLGSGAIQCSSLSSVSAPASQTHGSRPPWRYPRTGPLVTHHQQRRTLFIQTELTPNVDALKFRPNCEVKPAHITAPFVEYLSPRSTISPPYPSPLASRLMDLDGISSIFYGPDFITVTKLPDANWAHIKPEVFALITEAVTNGAPFVNVAENEGIAAQEEGATEGEDSLAYNEKDSEVVGMIKELLDTRIRPAIQDDGGDVEFCGFEDGQVKLKLRGACRTCDSSTVTLKDSIERMLMHYVSTFFSSYHASFFLTCHCLVFSVHI